MNRLLKTACLLIVLALFCLSSSQGLKAQEKLSEKSEFSVLTCSYGHELFTTYGHSALRVRDYESGFDKVFNWGTFNFSEPNFYLKFIRGKLPYRLAAAGTERFKKSYAVEQRWVEEQVLDLSQEHKDNLYELLKENYKLENRSYQYDFFYDNCSTRILDLLIDATDGRLILPSVQMDHTYRTLIDEFQDRHPWGDLGIDIILGTPTDIEAGASERSFLPYYLSAALQGAQIGNKPLVRSQTRMLDLPDIPQPTSFFLSPIFIFALLFLFITAFTFWQRKSGSTATWLDKLLFFIASVLALFMFFMWFGTDHQATWRNPNFLWALPTHFIALLLLFKRSKPTWLKYYFWLAMASAVLFMLYHLLMAPGMNYVLLLIAGIYMIRCGFLSKLVDSNLQGQSSFQ